MSTLIREPGAQALWHRVVREASGARWTIP